MKDTDFHVPDQKRDRFAASYVRDPATNKLNLRDDPSASRRGKPPSFASGGGGLVSTADDYLVFCRMMLGKGLYGRTRILSPASVTLMTMDHLTDAQKEGMEMFFGDGHGGFKAGWGFGVGVDTKRVDLSSVPGGSAGSAAPVPRLVDCNSDTGSTPAGHKIVTVADSLGLESFTISKVDTNITVTGH
jgi:CubicO group peptidase (beta-lactamase class C family)